MNTDLIDKLKIVRPTDTPDDFIHGALWLRNEIKAMPDGPEQLFGLMPVSDVAVLYETDDRSLWINGYMIKNDDFILGYEAHTFNGPLAVPLPTKDFASAEDFIKYCRQYDNTGIFDTSPMLWKPSTTVDDIRCNQTIIDILIKSHDPRNTGIVYCDHKDLRVTLVAASSRPGRKLCILIR